MSDRERISSKTTPPADAARILQERYTVRGDACREAIRKMENASRTATSHFWREVAGILTGIN